MALAFLNTTRTLFQANSSKRLFIKFDQAQHNKSRQSSNDQVTTDENPYTKVFHKTRQTSRFCFTADKHKCKHSSYFALSSVFPQASDCLTEPVVQSSPLHHVFDERFLQSPLSALYYGEPPCYFHEVTVTRTQYSLNVLVYSRH